MSRAVKEKVILGLDPGTNVMGYGIIVVRGIDVKIVQFGVIRLGKFPNHELKLKEIFDRVLGLLDEYHPDVKVGASTGCRHVGGAVPGSAHQRVCAP